MKNINWMTGILLISSLTGLLSCESVPTIAGLGTTEVSEDTVVETTDVKRIVTTGPSLSFNLLTGGPNSMAINPVTKLPAIAYYDRNASVAGTTVTGALKYAYMNSTGSWNIEVVDANYGTATCGTATGFCVGAQNVAAATASASILQLAFKADGTPAIAYAYGAITNTSKQIRFAERASAEIWTIGVAFTASTSVAIAVIEFPMKALTLDFDSSNRPHITFHHYGAAINTDSKLKYLFRTTSGVWQPAVDVLTISTGVTVAATSGAAQTGAAFCPATGKLLLLGYNMTAAATSDATFIQSASPGTDGSLTFPAGSTVAIDNGCTGTSLCVAAGSTSLATTATWGTSAVTHGKFDLDVDSAGFLTTAYYAFANPSNKLITATMATTCDTLPTSFSTAPAAGFLGTGLLVGSGETSPGLNGFRLASSATEKFIGYSSNTAQEVRVNKQVAGVWFTPGVSVEGTTAALIATEGVGLAYDSTNDLIYTTYGSIPAGGAAAIGNDIKVGFAPGADVISGATYPTFSVVVVDQSSAVFPIATSAVPSISAAVAANGTVGFALLYLDATFNDIKLYYGVRGGPDSAPVFGLNTVVNYLEASSAALYPGSYPSLAYDSNSNPVIAFHSSLATGQFMETLQVARSSNGGASFQVTMIDDGSATATAAGIGQYPSVATTGTTIGVAYYDGQTANTGLKFARFTPTTGWRKFVVDGMTGATGTGCTTTDDAGKYAKLAFTSSGSPVIAYQSAGSLKMAFGTATSATAYTWTCSGVDSAADVRGAGIDLVLSSADLPHLVHLDTTNGAIRYVTCSSVVTSCIASGASAFSGEVVNFVGTVTIDTAKPSIKVTTAGKRFVSHYSALQQGLVIASRAASASAWSSENIDNDTSGAVFSSGAGQYSSLLLNSSSEPMVFYRSNENWLKYFSREVL